MFPSIRLLLFFFHLHFIILLITVQFPHSYPHVSISVRSRYTDDRRPDDPV